MIVIEIGELWRVFRGQSFAQHNFLMASTGTKIHAPQELLNAKIAEIEYMKVLCKRYNLKASLASLNRLESIFLEIQLLTVGCDSFSFEGDEVSKISRELHDIDRRLEDELSGLYFFGISPAEKDLFEGGVGKFGLELQHAFPSDIFELQEAAKCLALERHTASAFHSIRFLEAGIRALSRCLGIADPTKGSDRSWHRLLASIDKTIGNKFPTQADRMSGDGKLLGELHASLSAMQNPYRNATMHLDQKYTQHEAEHIFYLVGGFMRRVAERCNENGVPNA